MALFSMKLNARSTKKQNITLLLIIIIKWPFTSHDIFQNFTFISFIHTNLILIYNIYLHLFFIVNRLMYQLVIKL